ncbi:DUF3168 domain-containing protein [Mesobacterium sp. TK19101]|uniref:DUF3168 domain-containing protein n=1 Tax=Mesobacterium hydrothermale TaxID=3111907 RepID=A0ABU6HM15_9RHOB|nr:DUF3168 domain-containing protein [Mesobacterium sp. TK19101]MEC3862220.1 DUF3168 domain-containing protein [Mesobacterium sp. TK19101]
MSYGVTAALQVAVYGALTGDAALTTLVGSDIYDAMPGGALPGLYVLLGEESAKDASDQSGDGAWHDLSVAVVTDQAGFQAAKNAAAAVSDVLHGAALSLPRGRLVGLWFRKARASRQGDGTRRIDMTFRARVEDN